VRTTIRSLERGPEVRAAFSRYGREPGDALTFAAEDLMEEAGWPAAVDGCDFVLHVASPVPHANPKDGESVIGPAREGTLRVLRAASNAGVECVVLTSAFGTVGFGHGRTRHQFTDDDWSIIDGPGVNTYNKSRILAERAPGTSWRPGAAAWNWPS
jgi:nucleoside-diphosphate-sugar epimerase